MRYIAIHKNLAALLSLIILCVACNSRHDNGAIEIPKTDTVNTKKLETKSQPLTSIKTPEGYIKVDDGGNGNIPVLFIHSFGGDSRHWDSQLQHVRAARRAIAMDLRGHGQSDAPVDKNYSVDALANDIAIIADSLHLDSFFIVGHSMGGSAAIEYAARYPNKVAGLLLVTTPGKMPDQQAKQIIASLESSNYDSIMENYMKRLLKNATTATENLEREGMSKLSKAASISIIKSSFNYDPLPALRKFKGPKMIITTADDPQANNLEKVFPDIPVRKVSGTSHWIQLDKPADFNQALDEFFLLKKTPK
jgi:pimeloyl-ACP methyl ester carboxylesterase